MRGTAVSTQQSAFGRQESVRSCAESVFEIIVAALREIFDEAAYLRFLERHQIASSPEAYAHFIEERDPASKPRCC